MFRQKKNYVFALTFVALVCAGALVLSISAMLENLRFISATNNLSAAVMTARLFAKEQRARAFGAGEDILAVLVETKQLPSAFDKNPWMGNMRITAVDNASMTVENEMPAHACRRMALYLLGRKPAELGLSSMSARPDQASDWTFIYPKPDAEAEFAARAACGKKGAAQLALVFKIRE